MRTGGDGTGDHRTSDSAAAAIRAVLDDQLDTFTAKDRAPGVVVGVVRDGLLVDVVGRGVACLADPQAGRGDDAADGSAAQRPPDEDTVFRIASMTKSFTAATVLALRDDGLLTLDDPVARWLPHLADPAPSAVPLTLRHLLTMSAGLPTDDPWGDRQQDMPVDQLDALAARGFSWMTPPGTAFEYSNLGYALLGRVVTAATGQEFGQVVGARILQPLGLTSTAFDPAALPDQSRLATGYVPRGEGPDAPLEAEPFAPHGAFSPMGGLLSSVRDLAVWVVGFLAAESAAQPEQSPPEPDQRGHPLSATSRREMSRQQRFGALLLTEPPGAPASARAIGYGLGLMDEVTTELGRVVHHSGGYPGFGSHMRWHPASGIGVIGLANRTYAPMHTLTAAIMSRLVSTDRASRRGVATVSLGPRADDAVTALTSLVQEWDETLADSWFADNMDRDVPRALRREQVAAAVAAVGPLLAPVEVEADAADVPGRAPAPMTPAQRAWRVRGVHGTLRLELLMSPQRPSLVQWWTVTAVVDPGPQLVDAARVVVDAVNAAHGWPAGLPHDDGLDEQAFGRAGAWLVARSGPVTLGTPVRGDGTSTATWRLATDDSDRVAELTLTLSGTGPRTVTAARIAVPMVTVA